jgi:hypothetical protein
MEDLQFYLAVNNNSGRYFVANKNDKELYCIGERSHEVTIVPNSPEIDLRIVGECFSKENEICNRMMREFEEVK